MMKAKLIAYTQVVPANMIDELDRITDATDADFLVEYAGRACYQSWNRPNPATANTDDYVKNILKQRHESVLEHASATFYITGVSRSLTHELIRHRHLSFSELSQRYVDMTHADYIVPPVIVGDDNSLEAIDDVAEYARGTYAELLNNMNGYGVTGKQARQAARAVMPESTETKIVVTGNHRSFREVIEKRGSIFAEAEIRQLVIELYRQLVTVAPATYSDFTLEEVGDTVVVQRRTDCVADD